LKTFLYTSSNFTYDITSDPQSNVKSYLNAINFDAIEPDHMVELKHIIHQGADLDLYARYIQSILNKNNVKLNTVLIETLNLLGSNVLKLPLVVHEKIIEVNPQIFEKTILNAILLCKTKDIIDMCCKSPLVFQNCSSIFNELLIKLNFTDKFMLFLVNFVHCVSLQCKNNNIDNIDIYPFKCRYILTLRVIHNKNSNLVSQKYLHEEVKKFALDFPREYMCLLSHFPDLYMLN